MLRVERIGKRLRSFVNLKTRPLEEFYELSDFISNSPAEFFGEIGESLLLVANGLRTAELNRMKTKDRAPSPLSFVGSHSSKCPLHKIHVGVLLFYFFIIITFCYL